MNQDWNWNSNSNSNSSPSSRKSRKFVWLVGMWSPIRNKKERWQDLGSISGLNTKRPCETHWPDVVPWAKMATVHTPYVRDASDICRATASAQVKKVKRPCETHWPDVVPWAKMATVFKERLAVCSHFQQVRKIDKEKRPPFTALSRAANGGHQNFTWVSLRIEVSPFWKISNQALVTRKNKS